ncbi:MAG: hypothetical protein P1U85_10505 [Verrucomicrobiales bacterium]|nr:hypothetical protein [Verrucomicrobiales bacterium]
MMRKTVCSKGVFLLVLVSLGLTWAGGGDLFVETYQIPKERFPSEALEERSIHELLEVSGMEFGEGASASADLEERTITLINTEEQLTLFESWLQGAETKGPGAIHLIAEWIEVEASLYHDWMFENRITKDGTPLRRQAQEWVRDESATIVETVVLQSRTRVESRSESFSFLIYPSEGDPPEIPSKVDLSGADSKAPMTGGISAAFECRNVGTNLYTVTALASDNETIDVNLNAYLVEENGRTEWPPHDGHPLVVISNPKFYTMGALTQVTGRHGRYSFVGTMKPRKAAREDRKNPLVLMFVRGDVVKSLPKNRVKYVPGNQTEGDAE